MPAMWAMGGSALVKAGSSIFSGIMGKKAAKKQAEAIQAAQDKATGTVQKYTDQANGELRSFRERGDTAGGTLSDLLSGKLDPDAVLKASSLFKFQESEGQIGINRELKARGLYGSGAGLESLRKFENQLVGDEGQRQYDRLFQMSNQGMQAAGQIAGNNMTAGSQIGNIQFQGGMAKGGVLAQGTNAMAQGISGSMDALAGGGMDYVNYKMLEPFLAGLGGKKDTKDPTFDQAAMDGEYERGKGTGIMAATPVPMGMSRTDTGNGVTWTSNAF